MTRVGHRVEDGSTTGAAPSVMLTVSGHDMTKLSRPSEALLADQCSFVNSYADLRADRGAEITSQLGFPNEYFAMVLGMHMGQHRNTFELITATQVMAAHIAMIAKHALAVRRPDQYDRRIMPMIPTPGHGSFPSAHATEAFAVLTVLERLCTEWGSFSDLSARLKMLRGLAERISVNRTVAGVHYPIDSWAGAALGTSIGGAVLNLCGVSDHMIPEYRYAAENSDFSTHQMDNEPETHGLLRGGDFTIDPGDHWSWIWQKALSDTQNV